MAQRLSYQPKPARREYIAKKNSNKKRPLGIQSGDDKLEAAEVAEVEAEAETVEPPASSAPKVKVGGDEVVFDAEEYAEVDAQDIIDE